jgi:gamma-glutamyl-gamma-aminobutyrate hydrolase PuuD
MKLARVFVHGGPRESFRSMTAATFLAADKYLVSNNIEDSDIVVWTGGEDINPVLYGEKPIPGTYFGDRDRSDLDVLDIAYGKGKFLVGICRGAQLLNVIPNGGKLWQDVDNHGSSHRTFDCISGTWLYTNSVHHQALRITDKAQVLAWTSEATVKKSEHDKWVRPIGKYDNVPEKDRDIEAVFYPETRSFLFQGHPEFNHPPTTKYFFELMDKVFWNK